MPNMRERRDTTGHKRTGQSQKTRKGEQGQVDREGPRARQAPFDPSLVKKGQTRLDGLDAKLIALSARGMTTRDLQAHVQERSGVDVSPTLISNVTEAVMDEGRQGQARPLEAVYPLVYFDGLVVQVRANQRVANRVGVCGPGGHSEGRHRAAADVDRPERGGQILALCAD
jgi:putative transposase